MFSRIQTFCGVFALVFFLLLGSVGWAQQKQVPKVENFLVLFDASGSMKFNYMDTNRDKAKLAKEAMMSMNREIPELDFQSGLYIVASEFRAVHGVAPYSSANFGSALEGLPTPTQVFGLQTPLAEGMQRIDDVLAGLSGSTAVILVTDGGENLGGSPVDVAEDLYAEHDICLHVLSYAQSESEKATLDGIVSLRECSGMLTGEAAQNESAMDAFVRKVFYETVAVEKDDDQDGVINSRDECPGTPSGAEVDAVGCPVDSDNDGVPDYKDRCPGTAETLEVNDTGCAIKGRMELEVLFATNSAELRSGSYEGLQQVARILRENPGAEIVIEGHTDNVGPGEYNMRLSKNRAESVKEYLVENYDVDPERLETRGYGETRPVADNDTQAGRRKNRRVVVDISNVPQER